MSQALPLFVQPGNFRIYCSTLIFLFSIAGLSAQFSVNVTGINPTCNGYTNGTASATATGGWPPYTYTWNTGQTGPILAGIGAGTYTVTVVDVDQAIAIGSVTIVDPPGINANAIVTGDICTNPGDVTVTVSGGVPPYTFEWSNGATTQSQTGLAPGLYCATVTDANLCSKVACVTVIKKITVDVRTIDSQCAMVCDGSAIADVMGGTPPYSYIWNTGETTQLIAPLPPGTFTVTVSDANGCVAIDSGVVHEPPPIIIDLDITNPGCTSSTGSITASASGGVPGYTFTWSTGAVGPTVSGLSAGTYSLVVTDANNCSIDTSVTLILRGLQLDVSAQDVTCPGAMDGSASAVASSGVPPYTYNWSNGQTGSAISNLTPGIYTVTATDSTGCSANASVTVGVSDSLEIIISKTNVSCFGDNDGSASATASGGTPPYTFAWSNGQNGPAITNLSAGSYTLTVSDSKGCQSTDSVSIGQPPAISVQISKTDVSCFDGNDGSASATASGGTPPYTFAWSNGQSGPAITGLTAGDYTVDITDADGCNASATVTILQPLEALTCVVNIVQDISIAGAADGILEVVANGGTAPYTYLWSNGQTTATISALAAGTYSVTVSDANDCSSTCTATLTEPPVLLGKLGDFVWEDLNRDGIQDTNEPGIRNVKVTLTGTDANGDPVHGTTFTDNAGMYMFNDLTQGTYKLTFDGPANFAITIQNAGTDDAVDSDINNMGMTANINLNAGDTILTIDAGFYNICENLTDAGTVGFDESFCGPGHDPAPIIEIIPPSGGSGAIEYLWMKSTTSSVFTQSTYTIIPGATDQNYDPPVIYETTYFVRCTRRENCDDFLETNVITKEIRDDAIAEINGPDLVCINEPYTYTATNAGAGATYSWDFGPNASPRTATGRIATTSWSNFGQRTIQLTVNANGCTATNILKIVITTNPNFCGPAINLRTTVLNNKSVLAEWTTLPELETFTYRLEKSADGKHFKTVAQVQGVGSVHDLNHYRFIDRHPKRGHSSYRVVRTAADSNADVYSNIQQVLVNDTETEVFVFPNPSESDFYLELIEPATTEYEYQIFNSSGKIVRSGTIAKDAIISNIDIRDLPKGVYILKMVLHNGKSDILKFVKN